jgi:hypothetical protein
MLMTERHVPKQQEEFREEAHRLLQDVLAKNDDAESRHVSDTSHQQAPSLSPGMRFHSKACLSSCSVLGNLEPNIADSQISVIVEFVAGEITDMLMKMISLYRPDCE